jgi:type I restriction enzyme S subunit
MMQQLLTGRIRLVKPQTQASEEQKAKGRNWRINEAMIISVLAKQFGTDHFPLGRKRYTKLAYLLHRHAEKRAKGYLKKAAGPYNPQTKYAGPERIAVENGYVRQHKSGPYSGFVSADKIAEAEAYFQKWYGSDCSQWLEQFRFTSNDDLELLTTIDMAAEELRAAGKSVDVNGVKEVLQNNAEWRAKLDRPLFSDHNIAEAIETCRRLLD